MRGWSFWARAVCMLRAATSFCGADLLRGGLTRADHALEEVPAAPAVGVEDVHGGGPPRLRGGVAAKPSLKGSPRKTSSTCRSRSRTLTAGEGMAAPVTLLPPSSGLERAPSSSCRKTKPSAWRSSATAKRVRASFEGDEEEEGVKRAGPRGAPATRRRGARRSRSLRA